MNTEIREVGSIPTSFTINSSEINKTESDLVKVKPNGQDFYYIKNQKNKYNTSIQRMIANMFFTDLPTINKERVDIELLMAELKDGHDNMVKKLFDVLLNDKNITEVNDFISWSNQFLAQLVYSVAGKYLYDIDEKLMLIVDDPRQRANYNDLKMIKEVIRKFTIDDVVRLVKAKESSNSYPLSKESVSFLKDFHKLTTRMENIFKKITEFSKNKVR
jgi:hypothetical protein